MKNIIRIVVLLALIVIIGVLVFGYIQKLTVKEQNPLVTMEVEGYGTVKFELDPKTAPETVANFIALANRGYYDGSTFSRVVKDFMIQGGDKNGDGTGAPKLSDLRDLKDGEQDDKYNIKGEFMLNDVKNMIKMKEGTVALCRSSGYDSGSAQFFIVTKDTPAIDGQYAGFGKVVEGLDVVHKIEEVEVKAKEGASEGAEVSTPVETIKINSIKVETYGVDYGLPNTIAPKTTDYSSIYEQLGLDPSQVVISE